MRRWAIAALVLLLVGCVLAGISLKVEGLDRFIVNDEDYEKLEFVCRDAVESVIIEDSDQDIEIIPATDGVCRLEYAEGELDKYDISLENGVLRIERNARFGIFNFADFRTRVMRLYLPEGDYEKLRIDVSSGDVTVEKGFGFSEIMIELASGDVNMKGVTAGNVEISAASGGIGITDVAAEDIEIDTASGDIFMKNVAVSGKVEAETASGDIGFSGLNAGYIEFDTASGDVEGSVAKPMEYRIDTASGDVDVPVSMRDAEVCRIETASGDIKIIEE